MVHAINRGGGGDVSCGRAKHSCSYGGLGACPPGKFLNGFPETHSGAFSAQYNDGKIVHQNAPSQQLHI